MTKAKNPIQFLLVEPVAKTPYPPLGLMKISSMLKHDYPKCSVFSQVGCDIPPGLLYPKKIFITSLFTWDIKKVIDSVYFYRRAYPRSEIKVGGIAASLLPDYLEDRTGIKPHVGILSEAEKYSPDYSQSFGRKLNTSITYASRGCIRQCKFCNVKTLEPEFSVNDEWEKDVSEGLSAITFWDNNWLASPNFSKDIEKLQKLNKKVDFNQGLDARLFTDKKAKLLSSINIDPIRFAFDHISNEKAVVSAINLAKKYSSKEIRVYVLYNYDDTPEDFYYRINLLNKLKVLAFPMQFREPAEIGQKLPGPHWNTFLLRAVNLSLLFYYRKGMITKSRESFKKIYGTNAKQFVEKLYNIYRYDKTIKKSHN